jgi:hypothetical protein
VSSLAGAWYLIGDGKIQIWLYRLFAEQFHWVLVLFYGLCAVGLGLSALVLRRLPGWPQFGIGGLGNTWREFFRLNKWVPIWLVLFIICAAGVRIFQGPRGLVTEHRKGTAAQEVTLDKRLRFSGTQGTESGESWHWLGYLEAPITGTYEFFMKVKGTYSVNLNNTQIFLNTEEIPQHLPRASMELEQGMYPLTIQYQPNPGENGLMYVYWTIPGGGYYVQPIPGRYLYPERPTSIERICTRLWRYLWLIALVGVLAPVLLATRYREAQCKGNSGPVESSRSGSWKDNDG